MTLLAALLALGAVLLALPGRVGRRLDRAGMSARPVSATTGRGWRRWREPVLLTLVLLAAAVLAFLLVGSRGAVFTAAGAILAGTAVRLAGLRARRVGAARAREAVAEACALLSANLRVGMVPARALGRAAEDCAVLHEAQRTLVLGGDVTAVWRRQAEADGLGGLRDLARAWQVGTRGGASLTGTLEQVAAGLSADVALRAVVGSELAASRATGKVMAVLPVLGVGMGYLLGGDPLQWLSGALPGWICLVAGVALACAGVLWIEALARGAAAQG
jgi:tight adherence protein B